MLNSEAGRVVDGYLIGVVDEYATVGIGWLASIVSIAGYNVGRWWGEVRWSRSRMESGGVAVGGKVGL